MFSTPINTSNSTATPIYLLGENALSCFLAAKLSAAGENPIIISSPSKDRPTDNEILLKEPQSLKRQKFIYTPQCYSFEPGKLLIITSSDYNLKADLMLISSRLLRDIPTIVFSSLYDLSFVETLLGKRLIRGYFNGWLSFQNQQLVVHNFEPTIILAKNYNNLELCLQALGTLHHSGLIVKTEEDNATVFWDYFIVYTLSSMLSAYHHQNIFNIIKNKKNHSLLEDLVAEMVTLAAAEKVTIAPNNITKKIFNTPLNYTYLAEATSPDSNHELNQLYRTLINLSGRNQTPIPKLNHLMKEIYLRINQF